MKRIIKTCLIVTIMALLLVWEHSPNFSNDIGKTIQVVSFFTCDDGCSYFLIKNIDRGKGEKTFNEIEIFITNYIDTTNKAIPKKFVFLEYSDKITFLHPNCGNAHNDISFYTENYTSSVIYYNFCDTGELSENQQITGKIFYSLSNRIFDVQYSRTSEYIKRDFKLFVKSGISNQLQ